MSVRISERESEWVSERASERVSERISDGASIELIKKNNYRPKRASNPALVLCTRRRRMPLLVAAVLSAASVPGGFAGLQGVSVVRVPSLDRHPT